MISEVNVIPDNRVLKTIVARYEDGTESVIEKGFIGALDGRGSLRLTFCTETPEETLAFIAMMLEFASHILASLEEDSNEQDEN